MLTEKDYCDYETCVALKELGYKTPASAYYIPNNETLYFVSNPYRGGYVIDCFRSHNSFPKDVMTSNYIDAPTMWEAQKWLREEENIIVRIIPLYEEGEAIKGMSYTYEVIHWEDGYVAEECIEDYDTYEEALSEGIKETVKILKEE